MALSTDDLVAIRGVFNDAFKALVLPRFDNIEQRLSRLEYQFESFKTEVRAGLAQLNRRLAIMEGKVESLEADVKEIYHMMTELKKENTPNKNFLKLKIRRKS